MRGGQSNLDQLLLCPRQARLYADEFAPKPFCFAVRRPGRFPEGSVSIESTAGAEASPVHTLRRVLGPEARTSSSLVI